MPDPIVRWRNPYFHTVRELIDWLPKEVMVSSEARELINQNFGGDFFRTAYQLAVQLGLYYESDNVYYPRFKSPPNADEVIDYLRNWIEQYSVPNPYTRGFNSISPKSVHNSFCQLLSNSQTQLNWSDAKLNIFGEEIGNDDILINTINTYSNVIEIDSQNSVLKLKNHIRYSDLDIYLDVDKSIDRNDRTAFFGSLDLYENQHQVEENIPQNKIYYGSPGTGKSHVVNKYIEDKKDRAERVTFHPEYDYYSFVGGYKPTMGDNGIEYKFVPQTFTNIYVRAWKDPHQDYYLVIEEINRGNCAEIFGDIFQLLDRDSAYDISPSKELKEYLTEEFADTDISADKLQLPSNLIILATMNTSDQSLYPMDSAFKRRWEWEYIPINYDRDVSRNQSAQFVVKLSDTEYFNWLDFIEKVNLKIKGNDNLGMDKCIGNYFIKPSDNTDINFKTFVNKAIFYLWNDVFKDESDEDSIFEPKSSYEDFFPIEFDGVEKVRTMLGELGITITSTETEVSEEIAETPTE